MRIPLPIPVTVNGTDRLVLPATHRGLRSYEPDSWSPFLDLIQPGDTFVDVGANFGLYAIAAAKRGAQVIAIEPDPHNARVLRHHARLNRARITVVETLAGAENGATAFAVRGGPVSGSVDMYLGPTTRYTVAPVIRLDDLLAGEAVDLLKIDVEGAELSVLEGAARTLREQRPKALLIEVHPPAIALTGRSVDDVSALLAEAGYACETLWDDGGADRWLATPSGEIRSPRVGR